MIAGVSGRPRMVSVVGSRRRIGPSLVAQLFGASVLVLVVFALVLLLAPVQIDSDPALADAAILAGWLAVVLAVLLVVLRRLLAPLRDLTADVDALDPHAPGGRLAPRAGLTPEIDGLRAAFNDLLGRLEDERRESVRRALGAQEAERARVAREMHDELGQALTALALLAERHAEGGTPVAPEALREIADAIHQAIEDVRRLSRELRPEALDDLGLGNALITLCRRASEAGVVRVVPHVEAGVPELTAEAELVVYRVAQEAVTNALRHAQPSRVDVTLAGLPGTVELLVVDNGRGLAGPLPADTNGIAGMRERADLVGGTLDLRSEPRRGMQIRLVLPRDRVVA